MQIGKVISRPTFSFMHYIYFFLCFLFTVLGGDLGWTWHWPNWYLPRWFRSSARENQRLLQWSHWWQVRPPCSPGWSWTWHHGLCAIRTFWANLQTRQFCIRAKWSWKQLGQGSLHRRSRTCWLCTRCGTQRSRKLWLPTGKHWYIVNNEVLCTFVELELQKVLYGCTPLNKLSIGKHPNIVFRDCNSTHYVTIFWKVFWQELLAQK